MVFSQKKSSRNESKRKREENLTDKDKEVAGKVPKTKKIKISKEIKHVLDTKRQKTNISIKKKVNKQKKYEEEIKITNKIAKKNKIMPKMKTTKLDEKDKIKDIEARLSKSHLQQCISAIFRLTEEQLKSKNNLFTEEAQPIFMQVTCIKIPKVPRKRLRILLPYSIVTPDSEVALFVCDLERGRRKDYEPTVEYYTNLFAEHGCSRINEIIPMTRVKTEFDQFELKRKLAASFDYFLTDSRIAGHLSHLLGKEFFTKRKLPTSVRMSSKDLKHEIDYALRKTSMNLHSDGDCHIVQIGNTSMKQNEILENILTTCKNLSENYPGGWANIRSLRLKSATTLGLPFYMTLKNKNLVKPAIISAKRPKAYRDVKGELSTFVRNTNVTVKPDGEVLVKQVTHKKGEKKP